MRYAVKGVMRYGTVKKRDSARASYGRAIKMPPAERIVDVAYDDSGPVWAILDSFALLTDRETAQTRLTGDLEIIDGTRIQAHDCYHDEPSPRPCVASAEWQKQGGLLLKVI